MPIFGSAPTLTCMCVISAVNRLSMTKAAPSHSIVVNLFESNLFSELAQ